MSRTPGRGVTVTEDGQPGTRIPFAAGGGSAGSSARLRSVTRLFAAAAALAARLDDLSLGLRRPITIALARQVLEGLGDQLSLPSDFGVT